jgi:peptidoglycan/LPS O-acetylase OafA/YrhL
MAYPIFLSHYLAGYLAWHLLGAGETRGWLLFSVALPLMLLVSALAALLIDRQVQRLRGAVKGRA